MPKRPNYQKTTQYRRKAYSNKKRPVRRAGTSYGTMAVNAIKGWALTKLKQKLGLNTEEKFVDVNSTTTATSTLTQRIAFATVPQGLTDETRVGNGYRITRVHTTLHITAASAATLPAIVRVIQVRNRASGAPINTRILEDTTRSTSPYNSEMKALNIDVLYDRTVLVNPKTAGGCSAVLEWTHQAANDQVVYPTTDTTGLPADVTSGAIATFWMLANSFDVAPVFEGTSRYYYVDN